MAKKASTTKRPRSVALPGMEDRVIPELAEAAAEYAGIRDERMLLTQQEIALKTRVHRVMKKHGKTHYKDADVEITIELAEENVKVKLVKPKKAKGDDAE